MGTRPGTARPRRARLLGDLRLPSNANHNPDQIFYYDEKYMLRRLDYSPQVSGRAPIAHYTHDHKAVDGFVFPSRRVVYRRDQHGIADKSLAVITLDLDDITVTSR